MRPRTRKTRGASGQTHVIPYRALGDQPTRTLLALLDQPRPTVRSLGTARTRAVATIHKHLTQLNAAGTITWKRRAQHTLRAVVRQTSVRPSQQAPGHATQETPGHSTPE